jgi:type II secretory pathway pseudopilin PulG
MNRDIIRKKYKGFSLFEILLIIGILLLITMLVFPVTLQKTQKSKLEEYAKQLTTDIYYQQQRSSLKGISGGISLGSNGYTIFDGDSLSTATETHFKEYPNNIHIEGVALTLGNEILFTSGEFRPAVYGNMIVTDGRSLIGVYINREGLIWYENL